MKMIKTAQFCVLFLLLNGVCQEAIGQKTSLGIGDLEFQLDSLFSDYSSPNRPGAAISVIKKGKVVFQKGYGSANLEYGIPITTSTVFPVASLSKQFTVFSILLLADQGKLSFDDDVRKFIPELNDFGETITLRHLAAHTSGLREEHDLRYISGWRYDDVVTRGQILTLIRNQKKLNFRPGEHHVYCNTGFTLLAEVVERVSGQSFAEFTKSNIFDPLKMTNSLFYDNHERLIKNRAYSYWSDSEGKVFYKYGLNEGNVGPTGLFTTIEDLSIWALNFSDPKVGNTDIISQMNTLATLRDGRTFGGAYGQYINEYKGLQQIYHGGSIAGFRTYLGRFPDQGFSVIVFSNSEGADANGLSMQVAELFLKQSMTSKAPTPKDKEVPSPKIRIKNLRDFEGHYWDDERFHTSQVYVKNDTLMWSVNGGIGRPLVPIGSNYFKRLNSGIDIKVRFDIEGDAKVLWMTIENSIPQEMREFEPLIDKKEDYAEFTGRFFSEELNTSYTFLVEGGQLVAKHPRLNSIHLTPVEKDMFSGDASFFKNIKYERDTNNSVVGLWVSTFQSKNLHFRKMSLSK
nr:serine hydrolase domain-containing protein [uncultured Allomuricauda sp.]